MPPAQRTRNNIYERLASVEAKLDAETLAHAEIGKQVAIIGEDVKSLLETRTFTRGMIRMASLVAALVSGVVSLAMAMYVRLRVG